MDHHGLSIQEITRTIERKGLRDLSGCKTPEASLANAISKDALFCRVKPGTYALQAVVTYHTAVEARERGGRGQTPVPVGSTSMAANGTGTGVSAGADSVVAGGAVAPMDVDAGVKTENCIKQEHAQGQRVAAAGADVAAASPAPMDVDSSLKQEPGTTAAAGTPAMKQEQQEEGTPGINGDGKSSVEVVEGEAGAAGEGGVAEEDGLSDEEGEERCVDRLNINVSQLFS